MTLELSRQRIRERALDRFKQLRTCVLARELCLLVRSNRVTFDLKDVHDCCTFIAKLCQEAGCKEPSEMCGKASEAVLKSEERYLELCEQSCKKCSESRRPKKPSRGETTYYVA
jgi:hypothetical protein